MGIVRMGIPERVALFIKNQFHIDTFIETGTFLGGTSIWASRHFKKVHTIEFSEDLYKETSAKYADVDNITFHYGDSQHLLPSILKKIEGNNAMIWLDAHWCSGNSYGEHAQCPLLKELELLNHFEGELFILIDDARLFTAPPPLPNDAMQYPSISEIIRKLDEKERYTIVYEDVIIAVPAIHKPVLQHYIQDLTTQDWENYGLELNRKSRFLYRLYQKIEKLVNGRS